MNCVVTPLFFAIFVSFSSFSLLFGFHFLIRRPRQREVDTLQFSRWRYAPWPVKFDTSLIKREEDEEEEKEEEEEKKKQKETEGGEEANTFFFCFYRRVLSLVS